MHMVIRAIVYAKNQEEAFYSIRFQFYEIGTHRGPTIWLYDNDREGIRTKNHLKNVLAKWPDQNRNEYKDLEVWVIPADMHY